MKYIVYKTTNLVNTKIYIGEHATETPYEFDGYFGSSVPLKRAIKKYGKENFIRETLFVFDDEVEAYAKEAELVDTDFVKREDTYNICGGGVGSGSGENHPNYGKHWTEEQNARRSLALSGENHPNYGRHWSKEIRKKMSEAAIGKVLSVETRNKISDAIKGEKHYNFGRHWSKEIRKKMSEAHIGNTLSEESKAKLSFSICGEKHYNFGQHLSDETKKKMSDAKIGSVVSRETRYKISIGRLGEEVYYQRINDIEEIDKKRGWKTRLAERWGVSSAAACGFIKNNAEYLSGIKPR